MIITTSQQRSVIDCCGCDLLTCAPPRKECESTSANVGLGGYGLNHIYFGGDSSSYPKHNGYSYANGDHERYATLRFEGKVDPEDEYSGGFDQFLKTNIVMATVGGIIILQESEQVTTHSETPSGASAPWHEVGLAPVTVEGSRTIGKAAITAALNWDNESLIKLSESNCSSLSRHPNENPSEAGGYTNYTLFATYSRYRFGVPENYSIEGATRSTWEMQWDEVLMTEEWEAWKSLKDAHENWLACEIECGDEPELPGPQPTPTPSLIASRSWVWGGNMENPWSEWFLLTPPDSKGIVKPVNVLVKCYKNSRVGVAPTSHGEIIEL